MTAAKFRAKFTTGGRVAPIEAWLKQTAKGQWSLKMDSVSDDMSKKNYSVVFENEDDRDRFKSRFTLGEAAFKNLNVERKPKPSFFGSIGGFFSKSKGQKK